MFLHLICKIIVLSDKISEFGAEFGAQDHLTSLAVSQFQDRGLEILETWVPVITQPVNFASVGQNTYLRLISPSLSSSVLCNPFEQFFLFSSGCFRARSECTHLCTPLPLTQRLSQTFPSIFGVHPCCASPHPALQADGTECTSPNTAFSLCT